MEKKPVTISSGSHETETVEDIVTKEEPLQVILSSGDQKKDYAVIMRTPVLDFELVAGFLFSEGIISKPNDIESMEYDTEGDANNGNVVIANLSSEISLDFQKREFAINSSCGVCGKSSINEIFLKGSKPVRSRNRIRRSVITSLPDVLRQNQYIFTKTGGIHAAGLFDYNGDLIRIAEDVGRHNAVDKIVGYMLMNGILNEDDYILQVSGRTGFEIVQKAAGAGISIVSSVSAATTLAIETAEAFNMTLISFARNNKFNIYTHAERILPQ